MTKSGRHGRLGRFRGQNTRLLDDTYDGSGNATASHSYSSTESSGTRSSSDHHSYSGSDDDTWTVTDYGSYTEEGDTGFYSSSESWSGSYTYDGSGSNTFSATLTGMYPSSSNGTGSYTQHDTADYSGGEFSVESYDPEGTVARQWGYDEEENSTNDGQSESSATTTDPMRTYTSSMSGHNVTTAEDEWHTGGASGPDGSTSAGSDSHRESVSHYTTFNWSDGGTSSSGTMDVSFSPSSRTFEYESTYGTPPSTPVTGPSYSGPETAAFEGLAAALVSGAAGAGHFVKMVHNGIEYGVMAAYAEGLNILHHANAGKQRRTADAETTPLRHPEHYQYDLNLADIAEVWRRGSVIASWLLDLIALTLLGSPDLENSQGRVSDSGEGRWTVIAAIDESAPAPVISAALYDRFSSRGEADFADKVLSAMRYAFGGHVEKAAAPTGDA